MALILVFSLFLLLFLPLSIFKNKIFLLYQKENEALLVDLKDRLLQEIADFQADLKPEIFFQKSLKAFEDRFFAGSLPVFSDILSAASSSQAIDPEKFCRELCREYIDKYRIEPRFVVAIDPKLTRPAGVFSQTFERGGFSDQKLIEILLNAGLINSVRKVIGDYPDLKEKPREVNSKLYSELEKVVSSFDNRFLMPDIPGRFLSDFLNFQSFYLYYQKLKKNGIELGHFTIGIGECDISAESLRDFALNQEKGGITREIKRIRSGKNIRSGFFFNGGKIFYLDRISAEHANLIRNSFLTGNCADYASFDDVLIVGSSIPEHLRLKNLDKLTGITQFFLILLFFALAVHTALLGFRLSLPLRRKFILIVGTVLLPFAFLLSLFSWLTAEKLSAERLSQAFNRLARYLHENELLVHEVGERQSLNTLMLKNALVELKEKDFINLEAWKKVTDVKVVNLHLGLLYHFLGDYMLYPTWLVYPFSKLPLVMHNNCVKFLNNLRELDTGIGKIRNQLERVSMSDALIGDYVAIVDYSAIMAEEIKNMPDFSKASPLLRMNFFLLPDPEGSRPVKPAAIAMLTNQRNMNHHGLILSMPGYPDKFHQRSDGDCQIFINIASRNTTDVEDLYFEGKGNDWPDFKQIFNNAIESGASGNRTIRKKDRTEIVMWIYYEDLSFILAGVCYLPHSFYQSGFFYFGPAIVLILALVSLLLVSEIMGSVFLSPLDTIEKAAWQISSTTDLDKRVDIQTGDEYSVMGIAFNQMASGLLQKQRLSRFVSGRLLTNLDKGVQSSAERVNVAVLVSDIRNFTGITEKHAAADVVLMLNLYFTEMEKAIVAAGGIIERFVGDAIVAIFYPDQCQHNPCVHACHAGIKMRQNLGKFNELRRKAGLFEVENGIGISSGEVISGSLGMTGGRMEFSVVGKAVGRASELEGLTRHTGNLKIVFDESVSSNVGNIYSFRSLNGFSDAFELMEARDEQAE
ncbi:MAG: adenylate/guanylate cyclase domain-containing protein [Candidatus Rifleibacteriota bacterium]